jgi:phage repressor protein C with HTH and peptisase S24 domain
MDGAPPNRIAELRNARRWSQEQLARACDPPTSQPQIMRLETGERKLTQEWMGKIAKALNVQPADLFPSAKLTGENKAGGNHLSAVATPNDKGLAFSSGAQTLHSWPKDLKIIGHVKAGTDGIFLDQGEIHGMAYRPPQLVNVPNAFAVYVQDESMAPAFKPGRIAWVHPTRPVAPGDDVIVELTDGSAFIKELVRRTEKHVICRQWRPEKEIKYDRAKVKRLYYVVGSYKED